MTARKSWDEMTKEERVALLLEDSDAYIEAVPGPHWLDILDGIARLGPYEPEPD